MNMLPENDELKIGCLSRLFDNTTTSYKYLFFRAILHSLHETKFEEEEFELNEIVIKMLIEASYPYIHYRLSFGKMDQIAETIKKCCVGNYDNFEEKIRSSENKKIIKDLLNYVPYRLISVFFKNQLKNIPDHKKNQKIKEFASEQFDKIKPIYKIINDEKIILHKKWIEYFRENYKIVKAWADWEWMQYLQQKNPNVPAISQKLYPPPERLNLKKQTEYWKQIIVNWDKFNKKGKLKCIYSSDILDKDYKFSLDHFLPWSFVGHNQLWNLIPVKPEANTSKSDSLPSDIYLDGFIDVQYIGLSFSKEILGIARWEKEVECFVFDLHINSYNDLLDKEKLREKYENTLRPLFQIAENMGFEKDWRYKN